MEKTYDTLFENKRHIKICEECNAHLGVWLVKRIIVDVDKPMGEDTVQFHYYCNKCLAPELKNKIKKGEKTSYVQGDIFND